MSIKYVKYLILVPLVMVAGIFYASTLLSENLNIWTVQPADITVCGDAILFEVHVQNISTEDIENIKLFPGLPAGVTYVDGTAQIFGGALLTSFVDPTNGLGFDVPVTLSVEPSEDEVIVQFQAKASCELIDHLQSTGGGNLVNNQTKVSYNLVSKGAGSVREEEEPNGSTSYNVLYGALQLFVPASDQSIPLQEPNQVFDRNIRLVNSGNAPVNNLTLVVEYDEELAYNGLSLDIAGTLTPLTAVASTSTSSSFEVDLSSFGLTFNPTQEIKFVDNVGANTFKPSIQTKYSAKWGCNEALCNDQEIVDAYLYLTTAGFPKFEHEVTRLNGLIDYCDVQGIVELGSIRNIGSGNQPAVLDAAFNITIEIQAIYNYDQNLQLFLLELDENGVETGNYTDVSAYIKYKGSGSITSIYTLDLGSNEFGDLFRTDFDGAFGLDDLDDDGYFDDLLPDRALKYRIQYVPSTDGPIDLSDVNERRITRMIYHGYSLEDWQGDRQSTYYRPQVNRVLITDIERTLVADPDILPNQPNIFNFNLSAFYNTNIFNCSSGIYTSTFILPPGVTLASALVNGMSVNPSDITNSGDQYIITTNTTLDFEDINYQLDVQIVDCDLVPQLDDNLISWKLDYTCGTDCDFEYLIVDEERPVEIHCAQCDYFETTSLIVERNTFGWAINPADQYSYTYGELFGSEATTERLNRESTDIILDKALPNDEILVNVLGLYNSAEMTDNLTIDFEYQSPLSINILEFLNAQLYINDALVEVSDPVITIADDNMITFGFEKSGLNITEASNIKLEASFKIIESFSENDLFKEDYNLKFQGVIYGMVSGSVQKCTPNSQYFDMVVPAILSMSLPGYIECDRNYIYLLYRIVDTKKRKTLFPNEFRPNFTFTRLESTLPVGFEFDTESPVYLNIPGSAHALSGVNYDLNNRKIEIVSTENLPVLNITGHYVIYEVRAPIIKNENYNPEQAGNFTVDVAFEESLENFPGLPLSSLESNIMYITDWTHNDMILTSNTFQEALNEKILWPVQLCNNTSDSRIDEPRNNWIAVEPGANDTSLIFEGAEDQDENPLPVQFYGPTDGLRPSGKNMMIYVGDMNQGLCNNINVIASYANCLEDVTRTFEIYSSYSCFDYPDVNPGGTPISGSILDIFDYEQQLNQTQGTILYKNADLQWTVNNVDPTPVSICSSSTFEVDLTSILHGDMSSIELLVQVPGDLNVDQVNYLYPANAGSGAAYHNVTYSVEADGSLRINLTGPDNMNQALPGFQTGENKVLVKLDFSSVCGFDPGQPIVYTVNGVTNCSEAISYTDQRKIQIEGLELDNIFVDQTLEPLSSTETRLNLSLRNDGSLDSSPGQLRIITNDQFLFNAVGGDLTGIPEDIITSLGRELTWDLSGSYLLAGEQKSITIDLSHSSSLNGDFNFYSQTRMSGSSMCGVATCDFFATTGEKNDYLDFTYEGQCTAGPDQFICTQTTTMAASGTTGQWTQEAGPSQTIFAAPTSPTSQITLGKPGKYTFGWTTNETGCDPGANKMTIIYEPNFTVSIQPSDGRPVRQLSRGRFYNPDGSVTSGENYPTEGGAIYDGIAFSSSTNQLFVTSRHAGIWRLDRNTDHGAIITTSTPVVQGDPLNQIESRSLFVDDDNNILYSSGWPSGTNAGALWRYDLITGEGMAFYPGFVPPGGGDPFPHTIGDEVRRVDDKVYLAAYGYNSTIPDGGVYIYDESGQSGKFLTPENTAAGGVYEVAGDPMPSDKCHTTAYMRYGGKEYLVVGFQYNEIWRYNITDNVGYLLTPELTAPGGTKEVVGDPMPEIDAFNFRVSGSLLMALSWNNGIWLYDFRTNRGQLLTRESTLPGGEYEVYGDAMPFNVAVGLDFDPALRTLYIGFEASKSAELVGILGTGGGIWQYTLSTNEAKLHKTPNVGHFFDDFLNRPVRFDRLGGILYGTSVVSTPGSGLNVYDLARGIYICNGETVELKARVNGSSAVSYQWNEGGVPIPGATSSSYSTSTPGFYTVTVTEGSCSFESEPFIVGEERFDNLSISPEGPVALCENGSVTLTVPSGYASYQWYKDGAPVNEATVNRLQVFESDAGNYTVQAISAEGCLGTSLDSVSVAPSDFEVSYTKSFDHSIGFGSIDLTVTGGTAPYEFNWSEGLDPIEDQLLNLPIGFYDVTISDANGCSQSFDNLGIGFDQCSFDLSVTTVPDDGSGNGSIDLAVSGGFGPFTFAWSNDLPSQEDQSGLSNGIYRVEVTDVNGCQEILYINLSDCEDIISYQILSSDVRCFGDENGVIGVAVIDGTPPYEFELFDAISGDEVPQLDPVRPIADHIGIFGGLAPSQYVVGIRTVNCDFLDLFESSGVIIGEPEELTVSYTSSGDDGTGNGSIDLTVGGATPGYRYSWSDGVTSVEDRSGLTEGVYSVIISDSRFCAVEIVDIFIEDAQNCDRNDPKQFLIGLESTPEPVCEGENDGEVTVRLGFATQPPFSGVSYTFRLIEDDGSFNSHANSGGTVIQEFTNVIPTESPFAYTFSNVPPTDYTYAVTVVASGINPPQSSNCLYGTYGFVQGIQVERAPLPVSAFSTDHSLYKVGDIAVATSLQNIEAYTYRYDWNDGNTTTTRFGKARHRYDAASDYTITLTVTSDLGCESQYMQDVSIFDYICETPIPQNGGQFYVDNVTGKIAFRKEDCPGEFLLSCVSATAQPNILDNAVSSSSVTYSDEWFLDDRQKQYIDLPDGANEFETGQLGKWRVKNSYAYKSELFETDRNFSNGTFTLEDFTWRYEDANNPDKWIRSSSIDMYSVNGEAIQERNVLDIPSAAKFGYHGALPYLTAQNAEFQDVYFESFENAYGAELEEGVSISDNGLNITTEYVHSGSRSAQFTGLYQQPTFSLSRQVYQNGVLLKVWVRLESIGDLNDFQFKVMDVDGNDISIQPVSKVANVGDWMLITSKITDFGSLQTSEFQENADLIKTGIVYSGSGQCWIDDLRIQPGDAQMTTYVYDSRNFRLLTVFDDQHFGLYYQYDGEGKLVRKQIETERGIKTVQETHYNIPKEDRGE
ncbi:MAG: PKD domain-containing protein [Bacteroidota bacterium]